MPAATRTQRVRALEAATESLRPAGDYSLNTDIEYVTESDHYVAAPTPDRVEFATESGLAVITFTVLTAPVDIAEGWMAIYLDGAPIAPAFAEPPVPYEHDVQDTPHPREEIEDPAFTHWNVSGCTLGALANLGSEAQRGRSGSTDRDSIMVLTTPPGEHVFEVRYKAGVGGQLAVCERKLLVVSL